MSAATIPSAVPLQFQSTAPASRGVEYRIDGSLAGAGSLGQPASVSKAAAGLAAGRPKPLVSFSAPSLSGIWKRE
jgi:hypothetical protein